MKNELPGTLNIRIAKSAAVILALVVSAVAQDRMANTANAAGAQTPKGVKIVASVPLAGLSVSRMYTQQEYGRTYLYIEHGQQPLTAIDVTKKRRPQVVSHEPRKLDPPSVARYDRDGELVVSPQPHVSPGLDNVGARAELSVLDRRNHDDVLLLEAFGRGSSNLADRDSNLVYFASPSQLLIVQDNRWIPARYDSY